jgi:NADPH:quinone reductase-like Zn-dependent oxidoreductase
MTGEEIRVPLRKGGPMRSYRLDRPGSIDGLILRREHTPAPGSRDVLIRVQASALNVRDLLVVEGRTQAPVKSGIVPLSDGAGEVVAVGPAVTRVKAGDKVTSVFLPSWIAGRWDPAHLDVALGTTVDGVLAEYAALDTDAVLLAPPHLSPLEAATLPSAALTAWSAVAGPPPVAPGQTVLTLGSGGVSLFALQFAKTFGARVISTTSTAQKAARLKDLGADHVIDYSRSADWPDDVLALTGGHGADRVIEVGGPATFGHSLRATRAGGRIAAIGSAAGTGPMLDPRELLGRGITIDSITLGSREAFTDMNRAIAAHGLRPAIDKVFPFSRAHEALRYLSHSARFGKVLIQHT